MTIWSCDEKKKNGRITDCRNPHGCHCREIDDLHAENERLKAESFALAAGACHSGYGDEGGNWRCKYQDALAAIAQGGNEVHSDIPSAPVLTRDQMADLAHDALSAAERGAKP